jgi:hypothetical protein
MKINEAYSKPKDVAVQVNLLMAEGTDKSYHKLEIYSQ